jgi:hypothetical protein
VSIAFIIPRENDFKIEGINVSHDISIATKSISHDADCRYFVDIINSVIERVVAGIFWGCTTTPTIWGVVKTRPALGCYIHFQQSTKKTQLSDWPFKNDK